MKKILTLASGVIKELIRRKDVYFIFILLLVVLAYTATISFGGSKGFERYFREIGISITYIFSVVVAVTFASRQIPQEIEAKTIYPILAHPVSRFEVIAGKYLGVLLVAAASFALFYGTFVGALVMRGDMGTPPLLLLEGFFLHLALLSFFTSLTILLSLFLSAAANAAITLIFYFGTTWFGGNMPGYIFFPHPELFDIKEKIIHSWDLVPAWAVSFLLGYAAAYTALFLILAASVFKRRNL